MQRVKNERGTVIVFITLMIVLLMIMVGMGLDTGHLVYTRAQGQAAVDAAALSAVSALASGEGHAGVVSRAAAFNSTNSYTGQGQGNTIGASNITYVSYDHASGAITSLPSITGANGVRVALETTNPYDPTAANTGMKTPAFLTPLMKLFGGSAPANNSVSVSAVSVMSARASIPIALWSSQCGLNGTTKKNVDIKQQPPGSENSCWTTFLDKSSGASDIKALFTAAGSCTKLPGASVGLIDVGTPIYENKGQAATVYDAANKLFFQDYQNQCWIIPVIKGSGNCNAKNPTPIVDFASICPSTIFKNGAHSYIRADVTCGQSIHNTLDSQCFSYRLVRDVKSGM